MNQKPKSSVAETGEAVSIINCDGKFVDVNNAQCELLGYSAEELIGTHVGDYIAGDKMKAGMGFQQALSQKDSQQTHKTLLGDGRVVKIRVESEPFEENGNKFLRATSTLVEEKEKESNSSALDEIDAGTLSDITENIRVETPNGTMTVEEVMLDIVFGENDVTKYKKGALSLHKAIDERLEEEEQRNPDSDEVAVLKEARTAAFSLYKRIQNGDRDSVLI